MENAFEQVKVISVNETQFTDKNTGEVKPYCRVTSMSAHNEVYIFNDYQNKVNINDVYGMYCYPDRMMKAKVTFKKLK